MENVAVSRTRNYKKRSVFDADKLQNRYMKPLKLAIMQPYLFPYIGYWQLINFVDKFVIMEDLHYMKQSFINRNYILINGQAHLLTLQLISSSQNKLINEIEIGNNREMMIKTIERAYMHAPYFKEVFPLIKSILEYPEKNLARFIGNSLIEISNFLGIDTEFVYSYDIQRDHNLKRQEMVLDICDRIGTTHYINAKGGRKLYDKKKFKEHGINLNFITTEPIEYKQFRNVFVENLSIIDIMMFNSKDEIGAMLEKYVLF